MSHSNSSDTNEFSMALRKFAWSIGYRYTERPFQKVMGPPIHSNCSSIDVKGCEVFIAKLPSNVYFEHIYPLFSVYGKIYQIRILTPKHGVHHKGLAYVSYFSDESAANAIKGLNNYEITPQRQIKVEMSLDNRRLYIGGLPQEKTRDEIWKELVRCGILGIVDVIVYRAYTYPWNNRGFAFIEFDSHQRAASVKATFQELIVFGRFVTIDWSVPLPEVTSEEMEKSCKLFLRNLPISVTSERLTLLIRQLVTRDCLVKLYRFKDFAFAHFRNKGEARMALSLLRIHFSGSAVEVEWGKPRMLQNKPSFRNQQIGQLALKRRKQRARSLSQTSSSDTDEIAFLMDNMFVGDAGNANSIGSFL